MRFRTTLVLGGKTATGIRVPPDVVSALGSGKRPPVRVTINGTPTAAPSTSSSTPSRAVTVPADLNDALGGHATAKRFFDGLSYSQERGLVDGIQSQVGRNPAAPHRQGHRHVERRPHPMTTASSSVAPIDRECRQARKSGLTRHLALMDRSGAGADPILDAFAKGGRPVRP